MSALYTALVEGETKEGLAAMVCELRLHAQPSPREVALEKALKALLEAFTSARCPE